VAGAHLAAGRRRRGARRASPSCWSARARQGRPRSGCITPEPALFPGAARGGRPLSPCSGPAPTVSVLYGRLLAIGQSDLQAPDRDPVDLALRASSCSDHRADDPRAVRAPALLTWSTTGLHRPRHVPVAGHMLIALRGSQPDRPTTGGLQRATPRAGRAGSSSAGLSSLALPGLSSFVSRVPRCWIGTVHPATRLVRRRRDVGIILASLYILLTYQRMFTGPAREFAAGWRDMNAREAWVVAPARRGDPRPRGLPQAGARRPRTPPSARPCSRPSSQDPAPDRAGRPRPQPVAEGTPRDPRLPPSAAQ
jgi:hypothetical protein